MAEGGKSFNSIDLKDQLLLVELKDGKFGGYKQEQLHESLTTFEMKFFVCKSCDGVGRDPCYVGEDQNFLCDSCISDDSERTPVKQARESVPLISAKCPLHTRGCVWKDMIGTLDGHLDECEYFVVNCTNNCQMILQRMELENHLNNDYTHRNVTCEHCNGTVMFKDLTSHHETCPEFPLLCNNECGGTFKRKEMQAHVDTDCPNTVLACDFKVFGCGVEMKRCELEEHLDSYQRMHLSLTKIHTEGKLGLIESTVKQLQKLVSNQVTELQQKVKENDALKKEVEELKKSQSEMKSQFDAFKKEILEKVD